MGKILLISFLGFLLTFSFTFAQSDIEVSPGFTPKSSFYFFDSLGEWLNLKLTFNPIKKAEKKLQYASERLAEMKSLKDINQLDKETAEKIKNKYKDLAEGAESDVKDIKVKGRDVSELVKKMEELSARHTAVLEKVLEKVPEQAKDAVQKALETSKRGHEQAIEAIRKEMKEGTIKKEELKKGVVEEIERTEKLEEINNGKDMEEIDKMSKDLDKNESSDVDSDLNELDKAVR